MTVYLRIAESEVYRVAREAFEAVGVPAEHAAVVARNLTQGELHGLGSHGVSRLLPVYVRRFQDGGFNAQPQVRVVRQKKGAALLDGDGGPGAVVGQQAIHLAIELAKEHGSGWVGANNSNHFGAAFLFAQEALAQGMIGFATTNAVPQAAAFGGTRKVLGTNPLCIAVPGGLRGPIILDMATTVVARGKIQLAALEGHDIPLGWALDPDGNPTTDAVQAAKAEARLLPLGGYKGYGLALIVEILSAVLTGAAVGNQIGSLFTKTDEPGGMGHFFGALDLTAFMPLDAFQARMDALIADMKNGPLEPGAEEILVPGERERRYAESYRREGIPIAEDVVATLDDLADTLGVAPMQRL
jgi:LDH2 family malate/lactate/ureidoglycolate dehydrogenase